MPVRKSISAPPPRRSARVLGVLARGLRLTTQILPPHRKQPDRSRRTRELPGRPRYVTNRQRRFPGVLVLSSALFALASRATSTSRRWRHVPRHRRDAPRSAPEVWASVYNWTDRETGGDDRTTGRARSSRQCITSIVAALPHWSIYAQRSAWQGAGSWLDDDNTEAMCDRVYSETALELRLGRHQHACPLTPWAGARGTTAGGSRHGTTTRRWACRSTSSTRSLARLPVLGLQFFSCQIAHRCNGTLAEGQKVWLAFRSSWPWRDVEPERAWAALARRWPKRQMQADAVLACASSSAAATPRVGARARGYCGGGSEAFRD